MVPRSSASAATRAASPASSPASGAGSTSTRPDGRRNAYQATTGAPTIAQAHAHTRSPARAAATVPSAREHASSAIARPSMTRPAPNAAETTAR